MDLVRALWFACLAAEVLLVFRLLSTRLAARFPLFTAYILADITSSLALLWIDTRSRAYYVTYSIAQQIVTVLLAGAATELYVAICERYETRGTFRRWLGAAVALITITAVTVTVFPEIANFPTLRRNLLAAFAMAGRRWLSTSIAVALICTRIFFRTMTHIHVPLPRAVGDHCLLLGVYCAVNAVAYFEMLKPPHPNIGAISALMLTCDALCFTAWTVALGRRQEPRRPAPGPFTAREIRELRERVIAGMERA